ncbi:MAG: TylF/MycF family methyltransferase [Pseudomonadales bacterium]|nr:TylF/MycF family methyltransferase [Pseudomonadales bacterium]
MTNVNDSSIQYNPSFVGKVARLFLPFLESVLPLSLYKLVYDALYVNYNRTLHGAYYVKYIISQLFGSQNSKIKSDLTWRLLPYSMGGRKALENAFDVTHEIESNCIPGAIVECGVAEGGTAAMMALASAQLGTETRQKWFFDSYEGLPEPTAEDYKNGKTGDFIRPLPEGSCLGTIEQVSKLMYETLHLSKKEVTLVKGWFQDTVPYEKNNVGKVALLRLDGDWYESTKIPLENFYDQIPTGGCIIIDDYATCYGSRKAVDEFRETRAITSPLQEDGRGGVWFKKI